MPHFCFWVNPSWMSSFDVPVDKFRIFASCNFVIETIFEEDLRLLP